MTVAAIVRRGAARLAREAGAFLQGDARTLGSTMNAGFVRDNRGVIMVVGVMFTFLWIGLCWALFGIGNAISYRENLQNATDAGAFAAAVYDARGMNMLASVNIVMGVVLAVLIAAHLVQLAVFIILSVSCIACEADVACGYGLEDCPTDCSDQDKANSVVSDVDTGVHDILPLLHDLEVGLAVGWPWVASGKSTSLTSGYYTKGVSLVSTFAFSQIPWSADNELNSLTSNFGDFGGASGDNNTSNTRYGLPVSSDTYSDLCKVAFIDVTNLGGFINMPGFITSVLNDAGDWFCDAGSDSNGVTTGIEVASSLALPCLVWGLGTPVPSLPYSCTDSGTSTSSRVKDDDISQSPMMIYPPANMGYDYFGVWGTGIGAYTDITTGKVQIAGQQAATGTKVVQTVPTDTLIGVSKSEFYYDPMPNDTRDGETKIDAGGGWPIHNVMWNLRWRARLRRYHYFPGLLGDLDAAATTLMTTNLTQAATTVASDLLAGQSMTDIVQSLTGADTHVDTYDNKPLTGVFH